FRAANALPAVVDEVLTLSPLPKVIWGQLSVRHDEAAAKAEAAGIKVVMDRCPAIEYPRLIG
ncbi:MAG: CoA-binding protein, partial [Sphingomonas hengshuiensis]